MSTKTEILNAKQIQQKIKRLAFEVYENTFSKDQIIIGGIKGNGAVLAKEIASTLKKISHQKIIEITIDIDKKSPKDSVSTPLKEADFKSQTVILIDDVINSGKTMMYVVSAMLKNDIDELKTVVLVDRKHRRYPIKADFVGLTLSTTLQDHIHVDWSESPKAYLI